MTDRPTRKVKDANGNDVVQVNCARCCAWTPKDEATCAHCRGQLDNGERK